MLPLYCCMLNIRIGCFMWHSSSTITKLSHFRSHYAAAPPDIRIRQYVCCSGPNIQNYHDGQTCERQETLLMQNWRLLLQGCSMEKKCCRCYCCCKQMILHRFISMVFDHFIFITESNEHTQPRKREIREYTPRKV